MRVPAGYFLLPGSALVFMVALLHIVIVFAGRRGYSYFGAAQLVPLVEKGSPLPAILTLSLAGVFSLCGLYGLSGAGLMGHLPLLRAGLLVIGCVFTLRGLAIVKEVPSRLSGNRDVPRRALVFSGVSLFIGALYLAGTLTGWAELA